MQSGLNIGIAAWIHAQGGGGLLPEIPALAQPFSLRDLSLAQSMEDIARANELSLFANRLHDHSQGERYLWDKHRAIIAEMVYALSALTASQRAQLDRADAILYQPDGLGLSDIYILYNETRRSYEDLLLASAPEDEIAEAYRRWRLEGRKEDIEQAIATKLALTKQSAVTLAQDDVQTIEIGLMASGAATPNMPTGFTPLSAQQPRFWAEAEVTLQALEDSIPPEVSRSSWRSFRQRRVGTVRFRFVAATLSRAWLNDALYESDAWDHPDGTGSVSAGDGRGGELPSYRMKLYMAQVLDLKTSAAPAPPDKPARKQQQRTSKPVPTSRLSASTLRTRSLATGLARISATAAVARPVKPVVSAATLSTSRSGAESALSLSPLMRKPHLAVSSHALISRATLDLTAEKLSFVQALLRDRKGSSSSSEDQSQTTYLVGYGRARVPRSPTPNPNYQWP